MSSASSSSPIDQKKNSNDDYYKDKASSKRSYPEYEASNNNNSSVMFEKQVSNAIEFLTDLQKQFASIQDEIGGIRKMVHDVTARQERLEKKMDKMIEEHHERIVHLEHRLRETTSSSSSSSR
jgi:archaellum component FlaC